MTEERVSVAGSFCFYMGRRVVGKEQHCQGATVSGCYGIKD